MQYGGYMTWFIDRRLNGKNKSTVNRQRFLRRYKAQIKQSISEAINKRSVTDVDSGESGGPRRVMACGPWVVVQAASAPAAKARMVTRIANRPHSSSPTAP